MPYPYELEQLAREVGVSPLEVLEFYLERAAIREECAPRPEAERLALADVRNTFANKRHDRISSTEPHSIGSAGESRADSPSGSQGPGEPITPQKRGTMPQGGGR